jgi:hypothetical protein
LIGYHGVRLADSEITSIKKNGLVQLSEEKRTKRLVRALSTHAKWNEVSKKLDDTVASFDKEEKDHGKDGQTHLTVSLSGLMDGFNQYLKFGSDIEQHVAMTLFGKAGLALLAEDGSPKVFKFSVPGKTAMSSAHHRLTPDEMIKKGKVPNIVNDFIKCWSYKQVDKAFQTKTMKVDCDMVFYETVPEKWLLEVISMEQV